VENLKTMESASRAPPIPFTFADKGTFSQNKIGNERSKMKSNSRIPWQSLRPPKTLTDVKNAQNTAKSHKTPHVSLLI
jgi:hypothetical protein